MSWPEATASEQPCPPPVNRSGRKHTTTLRHPPGQVWLPAARRCGPNKEVEEMIVCQPGFGCATRYPLMLALSVILAIPLRTSAQDSATPRNGRDFRNPIKPTVVHAAPDQNRSNKTQSAAFSMTPDRSSAAFPGRTIRQPTALDADRFYSVRPAVMIGDLVPDLPGVNEWEGHNVDDNFALNSQRVSPADPNIAVGSNHVLLATNHTLQAWDKSGAGVLPLMTFQAFFGGTPTTTFDPRAVYDTFDDRYVVVAVEKEGSQPYASRILVGGSPAGKVTPVNKWKSIAIDANIAVGNNPETYCDFPAIAVDEEAIYISCNTVRFDTRMVVGQRLWVVEKLQLYGNGPDPQVFVYDPIGATGLLGSGFITMTPARLTSSPAPGVGTWLAGFNALYSAGNHYVLIIRVDSPLGGASVGFDGDVVSMGGLICGAINCLLPDAPQPTAPGLKTNTARLLDAVWRNGELWAVAMINTGTGTTDGTALGHWMRFDASPATNATPSLLGHGDISGDPVYPGSSTFYPSIEVNGTCAMMAYNASGDNVLRGDVLPWASAGR